MVEFGDGLGLAFEAADPVGVLSHLLRQHLYSHIPIQPLVVRPVHHPHPAGADLLDDAVWCR